MCVYTRGVFLLAGFLCCVLVQVSNEVSVLDRGARLMFCQEGYWVACIACLHSAPNTAALAAGGEEPTCVADNSNAPEPTTAMTDGTAPTIIHTRDATLKTTFHRSWHYSGASLHVAPQTYA